MKEKEMEQEALGRRPEARGCHHKQLRLSPPSAIPSLSLLPVLIPHLFSRTVSFPLCIFLPRIPYKWLPLVFPLHKLFHPRFSSINLSPTGGQPLQNERTLNQNHHFNSNGVLNGRFPKWHTKRYCSYDADQQCWCF